MLYYYHYYHYYSLLSLQTWSPRLHVKRDTRVIINDDDKTTIIMIIMIILIMNENKLNKLYLRAKTLLGLLLELSCTPLGFTTRFFGQSNTMIFTISLIDSRNEYSFGDLPFL